MIDLHMHTTISDGSFRPNEVIDMAVKNGCSVISITDHDNVDAYNDYLFDYANKCGIKIIPGVEISTKYNGIGIHVLGYNIDVNNKQLNDSLYTLRNARHKYLYDVSVKLNELGFSLNTEELDKIDSVTKAHIALDIINNPINKDKLIGEFGYVPTKGEFIETIMNEGCPAYVSKDSITPSDAVLLIRNAGGKAVLAHPVCYFYEDNLSVDDILKMVTEVKFDGIETNYIYINRNNIKINDSDRWNKFAKENNLFTTLGSDFHNIDGIHPVIGLIGENLDIYNNMIDDIIKFLNK